MKTEELLKPRYKVVADYPGNSYYPIGKIIIIPTDSYAINENGHPVFYCDFHEYPHLFKSLAWWEERSDDDMPGYVKSKGGKVFEVFSYIRDFEEMYIVGEINKCKRVNTKNYLPSTKEEYDSYNSEQNRIIHEQRPSKSNHQIK